VDPGWTYDRLDSITGDTNFRFRFKKGWFGRQVVTLNLRKDPGLALDTLVGAAAATGSFPILRETPGPPHDWMGNSKIRLSVHVDNKEDKNVVFGEIVVLIDSDGKWLELSCAQVADLSENPEGIRKPCGYVRL